MGSIEFKVKRYWYMWVLGILWHVFAIRFFQIGIYFLFILTLITDIAVIFPEIHSSYIIGGGQLTVKRFLYSDKIIPFHLITAVNYGTLLTFAGVGVKIFESSLGSYKITYSRKNHKQSSVIICPKDRQQFMTEFSLHIDKKVILLDNTESAFKKKKDDL